MPEAIEERKVIGCRRQGRHPVLLRPNPQNIPFGWGDCRECLPDPRNVNCKGYRAIGETTELFDCCQELTTAQAAYL